MNLGIRHWNNSKSEKPSFSGLSANLVSRRGGGQLAQVCSRITLRELKALRVNHNFQYCAAALGLETLLCDPGRLENSNFHEIFDLRPDGLPWETLKLLKSLARLIPRPWDLHQATENV